MWSLPSSLSDSNVCLWLLLCCFFLYVGYILIFVELKMWLSGIPAVPCSFLERFITGHGPMILKARANGGVQTVLAKFRDQAGADVFWFRLTPLHPNIAIGDPDTVRHILMHGDQKKYRKGFAYDVLRVIVPLGMTNTEGEKWRRQRHFATPVFHFGALPKLVPLIRKHATEHVKRWRAQVRSGPPATEMHEHISKLTLAVIYEAAAGVSNRTKIANTYAPFGQMMQYTASCLVSPWRFVLGSKLFMMLPLRSHRRYLAGIERLRSLVNSVIHERLREPALVHTEARSLLDILLKERAAALAKKDPSLDISTLVEIRDQIGTFLAAGHETTASLLSFAMLHLSTRPDMIARLRAEAEAAEATETTTHELPFATAVLKETLRVDTPGPVVSRDCLHSDPVPERDFYIPRGTQVWLSPWLLHRNAKFWDDPDQFDPYRWFDPNTNALRPKGALGHHLFQWLPFSAGRRNCIGQKFALLEAKIILSTIARALDWGPPSGQMLGRQVIRETAITQRPSNGMYLKVSVAPEQ